MWWNLQKLAPWAAEGAKEGGGRMITEFTLETAPFSETLRQVHADIQATWEGANKAFQSVKGASRGGE
jgi:hypothetical protein